MAIEITNDDVIKALRKAVELKGKDYVYINRDGEKASNTGVVRCSYVHYDPEHVAGCLGGTVLHDLGVPLDAMSAYEGDPVYAMMASLEEDDHLIVQVGSPSRMLQTAQNSQDRGETWGVALEKAEAIYSNL